MKALKADLHIHSNFSDGQLSIKEIVDLYGKNGFDTIAITDHLSEDQNIIGKVTKSLNLSLTQEKFNSYVKEVRKEKERAREQYDMNVLFGYEITKNSFYHNRSCHFLILGLEKYISPNRDVEDILQEARREGAITIAAHPFDTGDFEFQTFYLWSRREQLKDLFDAWEVSCRKKISRDVLSSGLPLIASSDFHRPPHLNSWVTKLFCENTFDDIKKCLAQQNLDFHYHQI